MHKNEVAFFLWDRRMQTSDPQRVERNVDVDRIERQTELSINILCEYTKTTFWILTQLNILYLNTYLHSLLN